VGPHSSFCGTFTGPFSEVEGLFTVLICIPCLEVRQAQPHTLLGLHDPGQPWEQWAARSTAAASGSLALGPGGPHRGRAPRLDGHLRAASALPEPAHAGRLPAARGPAGHLTPFPSAAPPAHRKPGLCRRSPLAGDRWHRRQPVPVARFTAVLPRGSSGDTGARRHRQGDEDTAKGPVFGGSGGLGGGRREPGGPVWPLEVPVRGAVAHRPRPVGISGQARSVTAGAGLALRVPCTLI
jgi:hypothetical protein